MFFKLIRRLMLWGEILLAILVLVGSLLCVVYLLPWSKMSSVAPWVPPMVSRVMLAARDATDEVVVDILVAGVRRQSTKVWSAIWIPVRDGAHNWTYRWGLRQLDHCNAVDGIEPLCQGRLAGPRHIAALPDGRHLLISEISPVGRAQLGRLLWLRLETGAVRQIFPQSAQKRGWGDPRCLPSPAVALAPHSVDISRHFSGAWQVLVGNRGIDEAVEFYELLWGDAGNPKLIWRGCVSMPDMVIGHIAAMPDGQGFVATQTHPASWSEIKVQRARKDWVQTGRTIVWQRGQRLRILPSSAPYMLPAGALMALDGKSVYITQIGAAPVVRRYSLPDGEILAERLLTQPLTINWTPEGKLLVVDADASVWEWGLCHRWPKVDPCMLHFSLQVLDPETLEILETALAHRGPPLGAVTHAVVKGDTLYMTSAHGNRIARTTWPPSRRHDKPVSTAASSTAAIVVSTSAASTVGQEAEGAVETAPK